MPDPNVLVEAEIVHDLPDDLAALIGRVIAAYAKLEHKLSMLSALLLQLNKAEARIALRTPRAVDRLEMALDLFAIKAIEPSVDCTALATSIAAATSERDKLAHGLWLRHPTTGELFLRLGRGQWPKDLTERKKISRSIFPQSIPYGAKECRKALALVVRAIDGVNELGKDLDHVLNAVPDRFRPQAPLLNPLGTRNQKPSPAQREPSDE